MTEAAEQGRSLIARWREGRRHEQEGMDYLVSLPRRAVTVYLPVGLFLIVLLFPFYWMALTSIKPNEELISMDNPWWVISPTLAHFNHLLFKTDYPSWMWNTMMVAVSATFLSIVASVMAAYAIVRIRYSGASWVGGAIFLAYLVPPTQLAPE